MSRLTRRQALAGAAAGVAGATMRADVTLAAAPPNGDGAPIGAFTEGGQVAALPELLVDEQAIFYPGIALTPGSTSGTNSLTYVGNPYAGSYASGGWVGTAVAVPFGALLAGVDFVLYGNPLVGSVSIQKYLPGGVGFDSQPFTASAAGVSPVTISATLNEVYDGTQAYHAYYFGGGPTSVCRGIRVRYVPPTIGYVPITPTRVYDSRLPMAPDVNGAIGGGQSRTISVANGRNVDTGAVITPGVVPSDAMSIAYTVTVANTVGAGFLAINPGGTLTVGASTINWSGSNQVIANTSIVPVSPATTISVIAGGGSTHFLIDVVGYFKV